MKRVQKLSDLDLIIGKTVKNSHLVSSDGNTHSIAITFTDGTYLMIGSDSFTRCWYEESWEEPMININVKDGTSDGK